MHFESCLSEGLELAKFLMACVWSNVIEDKEPKSRSIARMTARASPPVNCKKCWDSATSHAIILVQIFGDKEASSPEV